MSFFTYFYLESRMYFQGYFKYIAIFVSLGALFVVSSLYLRHRLESKYRDLSIIFMLLIILLVGVQYNQYANDTSHIVTFLNSVRENQNLEVQDLRVNSQKLINGMILNIRDKYYEVHFNNDFSAYALSEINLVNPNINIVDKEAK